MYSSDINLNDDNSSHTLIARLVGRDRRVLDLGCADGSLGEVLEAHGCKVTGVESDAEAAAVATTRIGDVVVADLDTLDLRAQFPDQQFDVIVCGDVLEHVRNPESVLSAAVALLAAEGSVVVSVPNVAHGGVRLSLLSGRWEYQDRGLLDRTHVRFFTRATLQQLLSGAGLVPLETHRTTVGVFEGEVRANVHELPPEAVALVEQDPDAVTYQFIVKAIPDRPGSELAVLLARVRELEAEVDRARTAVAAGRAAQHDADALRDEVSSLETRLEGRAAEHAAARTQAEKQEQLLMAQLQEAARDLAQTRRALARSEAQRAQADERLSRRADERLLRALRRQAASLNRRR